MERPWPEIVADLPLYDAQSLSNVADPHVWLVQVNRSASDTNWNATDERIAQICASYEASSSDRDAMRQLCRTKQSFLHFSHRMANRCLRLRDRRMMELSLLALSCEDMGFDFRETKSCLYMVAWCAFRLRCDFGQLGEWINGMSSKEMAAIVDSVANEVKDGVPLQELGLKCVSDASGETLEWSFIG